MSDSVVASPVAPASTSSAVEDVGTQIAAPQSEVQEIETPLEPEKKPLDRFAPKFAALSRKEKEVKAQEMSIKAERAEVARLRAEIDAQRAEIEKEKGSWKSKLKENPFEALKEEGLSYESLTEMALNDGNPTVEMQMKRFREELESKFSKELEQVKATLEAKDTEAEERQKQEAQAHYDRAVSEFKEQLRTRISGDDNFELINSYGQHDLVYEVMEAYFEHHNKTMDPIEAAKAVEQELEQEAQKVLKAKKFQPKAAANTPPSEKPKQQATLTNNNASELPANGTKQLSNEESLREAAKLLRFT